MFKQKHLIQRRQFNVGKWVAPAAFGLTALISSTSFAAENLTGETAAPGGSIHLSMSHLGEVAAANDIANIQIAAGQTLTNSVQNVCQRSRALLKARC